MLNIFCVTFMTILVFHPLLAKQYPDEGHESSGTVHLMRKKEGRMKNWKLPWILTEILRHI